MKRLFRKDNRIARLVALWLVFIMALTPLYQHSGLKNPTKAAESTMEYQLVLNIADLVTADESSNNTVYMDATTSTYYIKGDTSTNNMYYWHNGTFNSANVTASVTGSLAYNNSSVSFEYGVKLYEGATPDESLDATTTLSDPATALTVDNTDNGGDIYAIYVKVGSVDGSDATNNKWYLLASYQLVPKLSSELSYGWDTTEAVVQDASFIQFGPVTAPDVFIGEISYLYAAGTYSTITSYSDDKLITLVPGKKLYADMNLADGSYAGFVKYRVDADESYVYLSDVVEIDNTDPALRSGWPIWIQQNYGKYEQTKEDPGVVRYLDTSDSKNYNLTFYTEEANPTQPITVNFYEQGSTKSVGNVDVNWQSNNSGYQTYVAENFLPSTLSVGVTYEIKATLKDEADNGEDEEVLLATICPIDPELKVSGTISDGTTTVGITETKSDAEVALPDSVTNVQQKINVTIESGYQITTAKLVRKDADGQLVTIGTDQSSTAQNASKTSGVYSCTLEFVVPETEGTSVEYDEIQLLVADNNGKSITIKMGDVVYDKTPPEVTAGTIKKNDVAINFAESGSNTIILSNKAGNADVYKFNFDVTDDMSEVDTDSLTYYFSNDLNTPQGTLKKSTGKGYYAEISNGTLRQYLQDNNLESMYICVKAKDLAGNETQTVTQALYPVACPDTELHVDGILVNTVDGSTVNLNGDDFLANDVIDNDQYQLKITARSGYAIDTIVLKDKNGNVLGSITGLSSKCAFDDEYEVWRLDDANGNAQFITIPEGTNNNVLLEDMIVTVTDIGEYDDAGNYIEGTIQTKDYKVGTLLYDSSVPNIIFGSKKKGETNFVTDSKFKDTTNVYQYGYAIEGIFTPGSQTVESNIKVTQYTISGAKNSGDNITTPSTKNVIIPYEYKLDGEEEGVMNDSYLALTIPESYNASGTTITLQVADEAGMELAPAYATIVRIVDNTNPVVGEMLLNGEAYGKTPVGKNVSISAEAIDNIGVGTFTVVVTDANGNEVGAIRKNYGAAEALNTKSNQVSITESLNLTLDDGTYTVTAYVKDKSGKESAIKGRQFEVDSTLPEVAVKVTGGTTPGKKPVTNQDGEKYDYYYRSDVSLAFECADKNLVYGKWNVTDTANGTTTNISDQIKWSYNSETKKWEGTYTVKAVSNSEIKHNVKITATDSAGNEATPKSVEFYIDTKAPQITATFNGSTIYQDSEGVRVFTADTTLALSESEGNKNPDCFYYELDKKVPDETPKDGASLPTTYRSFTYTEEAEYTVKVYSVDMAGNTSATRTIQFRIDKTAPNISIGGIAAGGTSSSAVTVSLNMQEIYWSDATGTVEIYMKSGEGFGEELVETIDYTPTGRNTVISRTFGESGIYRIEFNAQDSAGHTATASSSFTIDTDAPVVTLEGVANYDVTDQDVTVTSTITDKFYASKKVTVTGTVTDETGKVTPLTIDNYNPTANPTTISETFTADGIYDLTITCVDVAGNTHSQSVHFTIDKSDPVIGDLSDIDGKTLTSFDWDKDLDDLVSDLTVCDVHMYLNGQEYNGEDTVEDGTYVLLITAEDELGHTVEKEVKFTLDTKAPVFIVTGVEDKESRIEPYSITVSLQLEEDTLTSVTLNGEVVTITNNVATFEVADVGEYKLYMEAVDEAGNVSSAEYEFELESESQFNIWILIAILALIIIIVIIIILRRNRRDEK